MSRTFDFTVLSSVLVFALTGCASTTAPDGVAGESAQADELDGLAAADSGYTYFAIDADLRKCPSPTCGGWVLQRLNRPQTVCHDGRRATKCYAPVLDWSASNLSEPLQAQLIDTCKQTAGSAGVYAVVRGRFAKGNATPRPDLGRFVVTEAWLAQGDAESDGTFTRVWDNGTRCLVAPCPSVDEEVLNRARYATIMEVDWSPAAMTDSQLEACVNGMTTRDGILVAGDRYTWTENGTAATGRTATAAYLRLIDAPGR
jgi:hypothetical protein